MAKAAKSNVVKLQRPKTVQIDPEVKEFLHEVVVPILVREALAQLKSEGLLDNVDHLEQSWAAED